MPFVVNENPLEVLRPPLRTELQQALKQGNMALVGQVIFDDTLGVSYKPVYTCIREGSQFLFFGALNTGFGESYLHPAIRNNAAKAAGTWNANFSNPFPEAINIQQQSWVDYVLFKVKETA